LGPLQYGLPYESGGVTAPPVRSDRSRLLSEKRDLGKNRVPPASGSPPHFSYGHCRYAESGLIGRGWRGVSTSNKWNADSSGSAYEAAGGVLAAWRTYRFAGTGAKAPRGSQEAVQAPDMPQAAWSRNAQCIRVNMHACNRRAGMQACRHASYNLSRVHDGRYNAALERRSPRPEALDRARA
jgi:hypothetical protein